jgi:hypothetical protein
MLTFCCNFSGDASAVIGSSKYPHPPAGINTEWNSVITIDKSVPINF